MTDVITVRKIINGYTVSTDYWSSTIKSNTIYFKDMPQVVKHLDDCFVKPFKDIKIES